MLVEIAPVVLVLKILKCCRCILTTWLLSPLGKCMALHLPKFEFPLTKNIFGWKWPRGSGKEDCQMLPIAKYFSFVVIIYYLKEKWIPFIQGCSSYNSGSVKDVVYVFSLCRYYLFSTKGGVSHLTNLNRVHFGLLYVNLEDSLLSFFNALDLCLFSLFIIHFWFLLVNVDLQVFKYTLNGSGMGMGVAETLCKICNISKWGGGVPSIVIIPSACNVNIRCTSCYPTPPFPKSHNILKFMTSK